MSFFCGFVQPISPSAVDRAINTIKTQNTNRLEESNPSTLRTIAEIIKCWVQNIYRSDETEVMQASVDLLISMLRFNHTQKAPEANASSADYYKEVPKFSINGRIYCVTPDDTKEKANLQELVMDSDALRPRGSKFELDYSYSEIKEALISQYKTQALGAGGICLTRKNGKEKITLQGPVIIGKHMELQNNMIEDWQLLEAQGCIEDGSKLDMRFKTITGELIDVNLEKVLSDHTTKFVDVTISHQQKQCWPNLAVDRRFSVVNSLNGIYVIPEIASGQTEFDFSKIDFPKGFRQKIALLRYAREKGMAIVNADFSGIDFSGFNLAGMKFKNCKFNQCKMKDANLQRSQFIQCDIIGSNLRSANLTGANLESGNFEGTNLKGANLSHCYCVGTNFNGIKRNKNTKIDGIILGIMELNDAVSIYTMHEENFKMQTHAMSEIVREFTARVGDLTGRISLNAYAKSGQSSNYWFFQLATKDEVLYKSPNFAITTNDGANTARKYADAFRNQYEFDDNDSTIDSRSKRNE